jgi:tripartite-type tricarboxylate transporter receptor subunit TctC
MQPSIVRAFAAVAIVIAAAPATAQQYPSQPIKIIVSLAPGGIADIVARAFAAKLGEQGRSRETGGVGVGLAIAQSIV